MKRIVISFVVLLASQVGVAAQEQTSANSLFQGMSTRDYNRIYVGYNPMKIRWQESADDNVKLCPLSKSISAGYLHGSNITKSLPLYIEYGAMFQYSSGVHKTEYKNGTLRNYNTNTAKMYSLNVPVNVSLRLGFKSNKIAILPYAGLNLRCNLGGRLEKYNGSVIGNGITAIGGSTTTIYRLLDGSDEKWAMGDKALNRFQVGINAGVGFTFGVLYVGAGYTADVMKIANNAAVDYVGSLGIVNLAVGVSF